MAHRRPWRHRDDDRDWRERRGRYGGLDPDTEDRPQVKPVERPRDAQALTHNIGPDGIRQGEGDEAGPWGDGDG
jgi:hypothetical protein